MPIPNTAKVGPLKKVGGTYPMERRSTYRKPSSAVTPERKASFNEAAGNSVDANGVKLRTQPSYQFHSVKNPNIRKMK